MTWVRLDDNWYDKPETRKLSYAARVAFIGSVSYAARQLTDGVIPEDVAETLIRAKDYEAAAAELFEQGHWTRTDDGQVFIPRWVDYLVPAETVLENRKRGAERQARLRDRRNGSNTTSDRNGVSNGVTNSVSNAGPSRPDPKGGRDVPSAPLRGTPPTDQKRYGQDLPVADRITLGLYISLVEEKALLTTMGQDAYNAWRQKLKTRLQALEYLAMFEAAGPDGHQSVERELGLLKSDVYDQAYPTIDATQYPAKQSEHNDERDYDPNE